MSEQETVDPLKGVEKEVRDLTQDREDVCIPIAREILKRLANHDDLMVGKQDEQALIEYYSQIYVEDVIPLILEKNLRLDYAGYIFSIMLQAIDQLKNRTIMTLELRYDQANAKKWGVDDVGLITVGDIDNTLKSSPSGAVDNSPSGQAQA